MGFDDQLDKALRNLPVWIPPAHFAGQVVSRVDRQQVRVPTRPPALFWIGAALQGAVAAAIAYIGSSILSSGAPLASVAAAAALERYVEVLRSLFSRI